MAARRFVFRSLITAMSLKEGGAEWLAWASAGMGKGAFVPLWKCCKLFLCITKRSVDELFMHYFHNVSSASWGLGSQTSAGLHPWTLLGSISGPRWGLSPQTPNLPTPVKTKNPASAHSTPSTVCKRSWVQISVLPDWSGGIICKYLLYFSSSYVPYSCGFVVSIRII